MSSVEGSASVPYDADLLQGHAAQYLAETVEFIDLLERVAARFPTKKALAEALDIDPSRLTRALSRKRADFPFNIENCLRLAKISGESPSAILRAAGKSEIADLIESLYGKDRTKLLTTSEQELLEIWNSLTPRAQEALETLVQDLAPMKSTKTKRRLA